MGFRLPDVGGVLADHREELGAVGQAVETDVLHGKADRAAHPVGLALVQFLLTVVISAILFAKGEGAAEQVRRFFRRLAPERGEAILDLSGKSIRAVALGIVVTAAVQTALAGIGFFSVGVPFAGFLTAIVLVLCIAQIGPLLVMAPCVIWLYSTGSPGRGTVLLVFTIVTGAIDNVLRPVLIKKGADLSLLLILPGVIGGLLTMGIIGLFVGPVVLAVAANLLQSWVATGLGALGAKSDVEAHCNTTSRTCDPEGLDACRDILLQIRQDVIQVLDVEERELTQAAQGDAV